jgi:5-methylcytosine-specific restriction endonuclease McrA
MTLTENQKNEIINLYLEGNSIRKIISLSGYSMERVYTLLSRKKVLRNKSESQKGYHNSINTEFKVGHKAHSGKEHWNWKGGISKTWKKRNKLKINFYTRKRSYILKNSTGNHTFNEWEELKRRNDYTCLCCGRKEPEIKLTEDHIVPLSRGGDNNIENIQPLCLSCNCRKYTNVINYGLAGI